LEQRLDVADGEEHVTIRKSVADQKTWREMYTPLETETGARDNHIPEVISDWLQGVPLCHCPDAAQLSSSFLAVVSGNELDALRQRHICPVYAICIVAVVRLDEIVEDLPLVVGHLVDRVMGTAHIRSMRGSSPVILYVRHVEYAWTLWYTGLLGAKVEELSSVCSQGCQEGGRSGLICKCLVVVGTKLGTGSSAD